MSRRNTTEGRSSIALTLHGPSFLLRAPYARALRRSRRRWSPRSGARGFGGRECAPVRDAVGDAGGGEGHLVERAGGGRDRIRAALGGEHRGGVDDERGVERGSGEAVDAVLVGDGVDDRVREAPDAEDVRAELRV